MLSQIFRSILLLSCVGGVLFLILLALKPITKRLFGSYWQYYIWLTVLIVMVLPVSIKLPAKSVQMWPLTQQKHIFQENVTQSAQVQEPDKAPDIPPKQSEIVKPNTMGNLNYINSGAYDFLIYFWLCGACLFFIMGLINYWMFLHAIKKNSVPVSCPELHDILREKGMKNKVRVRKTDCINAPLMVGVFRTVLLLPNILLTENELRYILLHELTHLKRRDLWYKWFSMIVNAVHWFNPFMYFLVRQINEECEISCDLTVTQNMTVQEKNGYMNTILTLISENKSKKQLLTTAMASDKKQIKRRFMMIKNATKKRKIIILVSAITACLIISVSVLASGILNSATVSQIEADSITENRTNILLIGVDGSELMRADTLMLISLNRIDNSLAVLSIPRDTLITSDSQDYKICSLMAHGNDQRIVDAVRNDLAIPVNYYARINFEGFRNIIDILGGVEFNVPFDMIYDDPAQDFQILLKKGLQTLNGDKAEQLVRFRTGYPDGGYIDGDIGRVNMQQNFIAELMQQKFNLKYLTEVSSLYNEIAKNVVTNYPLEKIAEDVKMLNKINIDDIKIFTLPGDLEYRQQMLYFVANDIEQKSLTEQYFSLK